MLLSIKQKNCNKLIVLKTNGCPGSARPEINKKQTNKDKIRANRCE